MKKLYFIGIGAVVVTAVTAGFMAWRTKCHIEAVNALLLDAEKIIVAAHNKCMQRDSYKYGLVEERYEILYRIIEPKIEELLYPVTKPIRKTAEPRIYNYAKKVVYRKLHKGDIP